MTCKLGDFAAQAAIWSADSRRLLFRDNRRVLIWSRECQTMQPVSITLLTPSWGLPNRLVLLELQNGSWGSCRRQAHCKTHLTFMT